MPFSGEVYYSDAAGIAEFKASQDEFPDCVLLTWHPTDGNVGYYTLEGRPKGGDEYTVIADSLTDSWYRDYAAWSEQSWEWEYRLTLHYTCQGEESTASSTTVGSRFHYGTVSGRIAYEDGIGCPGVTVTATNTETGETTWSTVTDETGAYLLDSLPYLHGVEYAIAPTSESAEFRFNNTSVGTASLLLSSNQTIIQDVDFANISSVRFSGRMLYENTTIPVRDAQFLLNGRMVKRTVEPYKTDASGNFEFNVPKGENFTIQAYKEGHTFAGKGFVRIDGDSVLNLKKAQDGIRIYDQTKVRLTGRIVGGQTQADIPLGFGLSRNNLGDDLQFVLELEGDNISQIVHIPTDLTIERIDTVVPHLVSDSLQSVDTVGSTNVHYLRKRIIVQPDINTGEYVVDLFPVKYKITQATARGYSTLYADGKTGETLDLTNAPTDSVELTHDGKKTTANTIYSITYHSPLDITCKQLLLGSEQPYFGEEKITRYNIANVKVETILAQKQADGSYTYLFGAPVFNTDTYKFRVRAHEDYYYNNDPTSTRHEEVRIHKGTLKIYNGLHDSGNTQIQTKQLDANGEAEFEIPIDYVSFAKTGDSALRVLDLSVEYQGMHVEKQAVKAYVMGNKLKGMDYVASTHGKVQLLDVLRDPPGSKSYAYLEEGTSYKYNYSWDMNLKFGLNISIGYGSKAHFLLGTYVGVGAGIWAGQDNNISTINSFSIPIQSSYFYKHAASYTFTLSNRVETGSDSYYVGEKGDVYLGVVQNVYSAITDAVKPIDSLTYVTMAPMFANGTMRVVKSGRDSQGNLWYLVIGMEREVGTIMKSSFIYTHDYIENTLLPKLKRDRDALLLTGDSTSIQAIADAQNKAVYWSKVDAENDNFAAEGYYRQMLPYDATNKDFPDEVDAYNRQIVEWLDIMMLNEKEKITAIQTQKNKVGQWSVTGGTKLTHSETYEYSNTYSSRWDYPGSSFKLNQGIIQTFKNIFGKSIVDMITEKNNTTAANTANPFAFAAETPGSTWQFELTPILDLNFDRDPSNTETHNRKIGFTLQPDAFGYMDVSVYRVVKEKDAFNSSSADTRDAVSAGNDYNGTDYLYGSYVYYTNGGASKCPWEPAQYSKYYEPVVKLSESTLNLENQKLDIDVHERSNVPADQPAIFNLRITNEGEHEFGAGLAPITFYLKQDEISNPKGAKLLVDGMPLTGDGRAIKIKHGQIINKTLEVYAGDGYDFEDIVLNLASTCDPNNAAKCTFSVHYVPVSCPVNLSMPRDNWTMNTLSAQDSTGWYLPVVIDNFDVNYPNFDHIELQYKLSTQSEDAWVNLCSYYANDSLYNAASGTKAMITAGRIENVRFYGERDPMEQKYDLRAVSFCRYGTGFITRASAVRSGIKDTRPPRVFGDPEPTDAILGIGEHLKLRFNEAIAGNYLDQDNNFQIKGITNETGITTNASVHFDGTNSSYATTQVNRSLNNSSFTLDMLVKPAEQGKEQTFFEHGTTGNGICFGLTADNRLQLSIGSIQITSLPLSQNKDFTRVCVTYDVHNNTVRFFAGTQEMTDPAAPQLPSTFTYTLSAPLVYGRGLSGNLLELRLWSKPLTQEEISATHMRYLTGYERELVAYYPMTEAYGTTLTDKAGGATLTLNGASWNLPKGISIAIKKDERVRLEGNLLGRSAIYDETLMFWFRSTTGTGHLFAAGHVNDTTGTLFELVDGNLLLHSGAKSIQAGNAENNAWHHLALTINRGYNTASVFLDGEMTAMLKADDLIGVSGAMYLGGNGFEGNIDEFVLFEQALPKVLVEQYGHQSPAGDEMGIMAYLPFEEQKPNANNVIELVFSPNDRHEFRDANGNKVDKVQPLVIGVEVNGKEGIKQVSDLADKTIYAPVYSGALLSNLNFDWAFNNDELLINLKMYDREINKQTVYVTVRDVEDLNGNPMPSPVTWVAYVDRNALRWEKSQLNFWTSDEYINSNFNYREIRIINNSGKRHQFSIESLPEWITADKTSGTILPEEEISFRFDYSTSIPFGTYSDVIYLTDENGLSEPLKLVYEFEPTCPWSEPRPSDYTMNMNICAQILVNGVYDTDTRDKVIALYNDECVGMANVTFDPLTNRSEAYLTIYGSDEMFRKPLSFALWQASTGKVIFLNSSQNMLFAHGYVYGCGNGEIVKLEAMAGNESQNISLNEGWTWISFNIINQDDTPNLSHILSTSKPWTEGDLIKNPSTRQFSSYSADSAIFMGTLTRLYYTQIYMVYSHIENTLRYNGFGIIPEDMYISVRGDGQWSPFPCLFNKNTPINEAMADYYDNATEGDLIKGQTTFAYFSSDKRWVGSLAALRPGEGYLFRRMGLGSKTIHFYDREENNAPRHNAMAANKQTDFCGNAETNMTMIATVENEGLRAFIGDELVGVAMPVDLNNETLFFLTISSDAVGELRFETENGTPLVPMTKDEQPMIIGYTADSHHGTLKAPIILRPSDNRPYKIIENSHVVIIRNNEKYDVTGKKL